MDYNLLELQYSIAGFLHFLHGPGMNFVLSHDSEFMQLHPPVPLKLEKFVTHNRSPIISI